MGVNMNRPAMNRRTINNRMRQVMNYPAVVAVNELTVVGLSRSTLFATASRHSGVIASQSLLIIMAVIG